MQRANTRRSRMASACAVVGLAFGWTLGTARADYQSNVVMSGLSNPRGLAFGPDGSLYVAEAGRGGPLPGLVPGDGVPNTFGTSGALSRLRSGLQQRVVKGLPSLAPASGAGATGLHDIAFDASGAAFGVIGLGTDPSRRADLGPAGVAFGQLVRLGFAGEPVVPIADVAGYEATNNPDGAQIDSNPYSLVARPGGGFVVADAGANALLDVTADGGISTRFVLPSQPNPLPFGPPVFAPVPTAVALGLDGAFFAGELTGFPFPLGAADVYRLDPLTGEATIAHSGFTNIIDLAFGPEGDLFVLQFTTNGLASPTGPGPGALFRLDALTGERELIAGAGLSFPGGVVVGPDGSIYVSNFGTSPGGGQVLQLSAIPEPSTLVLVGLGLLGVLSSCRGRRERRDSPPTRRFGLIQKS